MEKKYTNYDEIDFAEEPSFIRWVQGKDQKATAFWKEWTKSHPEKATDIQAAKVLVQAIKIKEEEPAAARIKQLWNKIDAETKEEVKETAIVRSLGRRRWLSVAAAACIGLVAFFALYNPTTTVTIGKGEHLAYTLPDNSKIELNADSEISFKVGDFEEDRIIHLKGEAFFEVEKGQSFKVITPNGQVEVLGTSFNVNARDGNLIVACRTGKVKVTAKGSEQILTKGLGTKLNDKKTALEEKYPTNIARQIGWRSGDFYLENVTFRQAVETLERQFDVQIATGSALKNKVGDYTFKSDNLEQALKEVLFQLNADFTISGKKVSIKAK